MQIKQFLTDFIHFLNIFSLLLFPGYVNHRILLELHFINFRAQIILLILQYFLGSENNFLAQK